jgi:dihydrofolate synthase/folylpolyglutamate synthase
MSSDSLGRWLDRLETLHSREIELGLDRVAAVAEALGLRHPEQPVVTVAGTNGKGSTVAVLEALLTECGQLVGAYTSPHVLRFNERIRVGGQEIPDADIVAAFERIDRARGETSLTYFEFATLAALQVFQERACDVLLLEVGLGGRLDAVNIIDTSVAVITSIALDHQDWLGEGRGEIAREKAGILRRGRPVVIADPDPPEELADCVVAAGAEPVMRLGKEFSVEEAGDRWMGRLYRGKGTLRPLPAMSSGPLLPANVCAALQAALLIGCDFSDRQLLQAAGRFAAPGRRQIARYAGRECILDVAHNPAAVSKLHEYIDARCCNGKRYAIFSAMADKDIPGMIRAAGDSFDAWFPAGLPAIDRAEHADRIAAMLRQERQAVKSVSESVGEALERARCAMGVEDQMVVFGSFYTVAEALPLMSRNTGV